jgi:DNA uptake protein ComE-like DNA-binding protein
MKDSDKSHDGGKHTPSASFVIGAIALVFLIIGYQMAIFIHQAAVEKIVANHDHPDTVFIYSDAHGADIPATGSQGQILKQVQHDQKNDHSGQNNQEYQGPLNGHAELVSGSKFAGMVSGSVVIRKNSKHSPMAEKIRIANTPRHYECFRFDPNTASIDDLMRLGFTQKQAQAIDNYRKKGGRFRRKSDFAKSYVVEDSVYQRLEPYIDIPRIDLNTADSATFETLPGIGKYFASKMVSYRNALGGYSYPEQLMDIWHFDQEKYDGLKDLIFINPSTTTAYQLWTLPEEQLAKHPYIGKYSAHTIVIFRNNTPREQWSVEALAKAGILKNEYAAKLSRCLIAPPE